MTPQRVSLITLGVTDLARSRNFYEDLGWQAHPSSSDDIAMFQMSGLVLGLFDMTALADDQGRPGATLGTGAITLAQNFRSTEEVDAAFAAAIGAGATALKAPQDVFWGGYSGYFADPDGHVWEVAMNPFWVLDENGTPMLSTATRDDRD